MRRRRAVRPEIAVRESDHDIFYLGRIGQFSHLQGLNEMSAILIDGHPQCTSDLNWVFPLGHKLQKTLVLLPWTKIAKNILIPINCAKTMQFYRANSHFMGL